MGHSSDDRVDHYFVHGLVFEEKETGTPGRRRPTNNKEGGARAHKWLSLVKNCEI